MSDYRHFGEVLIEEDEGNELKVNELVANSNPLQRFILPAFAELKRGADRLAGVIRS